jgi:predicted nucleotidyltransferase
MHYDSKVEMMLIETSLRELYDSAVAAFPNTTKRQHATDPIVVTNLRWTPFVGMKTLFIKAIAQSEGKEYNPIVLFKKVNYNGDQVQITASDMREVSFDKLSLENTDVLLRCNCPDFYWRFNYYNHLDKSLQGPKRKKYEALGIGPPANPQEMPGMCKHLMKTVHVLAEAGIFANNALWSENYNAYPSIEWIKDQLYYTLYEELETDLLGAFVVGSVAKGTSHADSDLDIAVVIEPVERFPDPIKLTDFYHSRFTSDWQKPMWNNQIVDFQFFYPNDPILQSYNKIPLS